jgi:hypothetical protein
MNSKWYYLKMYIPEQGHTEAPAQKGSEGVMARTAGFVIGGILRASTACADLAEAFASGANARKSIEQHRVALEIAMECENLFLAHQDAMQLVDFELGFPEVGLQDFTQYRLVMEDSEDKLVIIDKYVGEKSFNHQDKLPVIYKNGESHYEIKILDPVMFDGHAFIRNGLDISVAPEAPVAQIVMTPFTHTNDRTEEALQYGERTGSVGGYSSRSVRPQSEISVDVNLVPGYLLSLAPSEILGTQG